MVIFFEETSINTSIRNLVLVSSFSIFCQWTTLPKTDETITMTIAIIFAPSQKRTTCEAHSFPSSVCCTPDRLEALDTHISAYVEAFGEAFPKMKARLTYYNVGAVNLPSYKAEDQPLGDVSAKSCNRRQERIEEALRAAIDDKVHDPRERQQCQYRLQFASLQDFFNKERWADVFDDQEAAVLRQQGAIE